MRALLKNKILLAYYFIGIPKPSIDFHLNLKSIVYINTYVYVYGVGMVKIKYRERK